jgi:hypothetical protein
MEIMIVNRKFKTELRQFKPNEAYVVSPRSRDKFKKQFEALSIKHKDPAIANAVKFVNLDGLMKQAAHKEDFKNLLIIRSGGIGDIIALSSIADYFTSTSVHFATSPNYFPVFNWFQRHVNPISLDGPLFVDFSHFNRVTKYSNWARLQAEGLVEQGSKRNWFEVFYNSIGLTNADPVYLRPELKTKRINEWKISNIQDLQIEKYGCNSDLVEGVIEMNYTPKSLLICNKASCMMRTINVSEILESLSDEVKGGYDIFLYRNNLSNSDLDYIENHSTLIYIIEKSDLSTFLLDCYDADMVISVDTGALHFREGIKKPAIGLYNSFTSDSRTKYYRYTKSFDIKSRCDLQPCFLHETTRPFCQKGTKESFAAPCFDSKFNLTLHEQLSKIFNENL